MHRDINDLKNKIVTKDELQEMMEGLKGEIMEVLKNFVTEKTHGSENASHEIHDEDTRKFDGKDPIL
jgi:gas vesicle protein